MNIANCIISIILSKLDDCFQSLSGICRLAEPIGIPVLLIEHTYVGSSRPNNLSVHIGHCITDVLSLTLSHKNTWMHVLEEVGCLTVKK